jgi:hypothetical protein
VKKAILIILFLGITFLGCSDNLDNIIVSTPIETENFTNSGMIISETENLNHSSQSLVITNNIDYCDQNISASKLIDGEIGAWLIVNETYVNSEGREVFVYARLRILPGAYQGTVNIEMLFNDEDASVQLFPEMTFNREVRLDLWFQGIDLKALGYRTTGDADFAYFANNGDVELVENNSSNVNIKENKIAVVNAKLLHFSRYGWVR